jgi:small-conductance mechanosensitive channel
VQLLTADDTMVTLPHSHLWTSAIFNDNNGARSLQCSADFYLHPRHDAALVRQKLQDVALTSPYLAVGRPVAVVLAEKPWGTHYRLKAYPIDARDQFAFKSDLTVRGKAALARLGVEPACAPTLASLEAQ